MPRAAALPSAEVTKGVWLWRGAFIGNRTPSFEAFDESGDKGKGSIAGLSLSGMYGVSDTRGYFLSLHGGRLIGRGKDAAEDYSGYSLSTGLVFETKGKTAENDEDKTAVSFYFGLGLSYRKLNYEDFLDPEENERREGMTLDTHCGMQITAPFSNRIAFEHFLDLHGFASATLTPGVGLVYRLTEKETGPAVAVDFVLNFSLMTDVAEPWAVSVALIW
jgi:hypothetical protein